MPRCREGSSWVRNDLSEAIANPEHIGIRAFAHIAECPIRAQRTLASRTSHKSKYLEQVVSTFLVGTSAGSLRSLIMVDLDFLAVTIEIDRAGELRNVSSVTEAAEVLMMQWPRHKGKALAAARQACLDALEGKETVENARAAFIAAAEEARILVWSSAWQF